jgi:hypothetical protein
MRLTTLSSFDHPAGIILKLQSFPEGPFGVGFDSCLRLNRNGANHILTLVLRLHLKRAPTGALAPSRHRNGTFLLKSPSQRSEWEDFERTFKLECLRWNDRVWLIPPARFSKLDVTVGHRCVRPNIACHLQVNVVVGAPGAHRTIAVIPLDRRLDAAPLYARQANRISATLQSNQTLCQSQDPMPDGHCLRDHAGHRIRHVNVPSAGEEIAKALGLRPVSLDDGDPLFAAAGIAFDHAVPNETGIAAGQSAPNRMGLLKWPESNATPWRDRIAVHTRTIPADWLVSLSHVSPEPI